MVLGDRSRFECDEKLLETNNDGREEDYNRPEGQGEGEEGRRERRGVIPVITAGNGLSASMLGRIPWRRREFLYLFNKRNIFVLHLRFPLNPLLL